MTRKDYMDGKVTHEAFYGSVAKAAGIDFSQSADLPRIKAALAKGDEHLNSIPLTWWDTRAAMAQGAIARALKAHGDFYSLAGGVCTLKAAAKMAAQA